VAIARADVCADARARLKTAWPVHFLRSFSMIHCVLHDPADSVAVVVTEGVTAGATLTGLILDENKTITLPCVQDIPLGHKVALKDMAVGDTVIKYGIDIGKVVAPIKKGQHAHVHNIKTKRW
jgi:(2R)-sulfolactate sulfo-lyase subunit alpha